MEWLDWIIAHQELILEILGFIVGIAWLAYKQKKRFDESGEASAWQYALVQGMAFLRELSAIAVRDVTEADVRMAADVTWRAIRGEEKYREAFGDALWLMWQKFVRGNIQTEFQLLYRPIRAIAGISVGNRMRTWSADLGKDFTDDGHSPTCFVDFRQGRVRWNPANPPAAGVDNISISYSYDVAAERLGPKPPAESPQSLLIW